MACFSALIFGAVKIIDNSLSVEGEANSPEDYQGLLLLLSQLPEGINLGENNVAPASVSTFMFSAIKSDGKISLEGFAPDRSVSQNIISFARELFPEAPITYNVKVAEGVPEGLDWNEAARHVPGVAFPVV